MKNIRGGYRKNHSILNGVDLRLKDGETFAIIGQNGAGKSTLAKAIMGMLPIREGDMIWNGTIQNGKTCSEMMMEGIGYFMQGGRMFQHLSVKENLLFAGRGLKRRVFTEEFKQLKEFFPLLKNIQKENIEASYLSGGERHQLALAMVLINQPKLLILDEPSAGLSPANTERMYQTLERIRERNDMSILLIEQNVSKAIAFAHRLVLLRNGRIEKSLDVNGVDVIEEINEFYFE
ncbi:MAG: ATP-binding cassette domain-containing protein [Marinifilaceae bacterium]